ncbi:MAG: DUF2550 domain-containing protein [Propioniciclava sp.]
MPEWLGMGELVLICLAALLLLPIVGMVVRRRWLAGRGRLLFDCSLRAAAPSRGHGWMLGLGRYVGDNLEWYRVYSWSLRPRVILGRTSTQVENVRTPHTEEADALLPGQLVAELGGQYPGLAIAMDRDHLTAFHSWTEAGAPGGGL